MSQKPITQAVKLQIIKPLDCDCDWEELGQVLRDLRYKTSKICNAAIQIYYSWDCVRNITKSQCGKYPKDKDLLGTSIQNYAYRELRKIYPEISSNNISQTNQFAYKRWKNDLPEIKRLQKSIPNFKLNTPIQVAKQSYKIEYNNGNYILKVTFLSKQAKKGRYEILLHSGDNSKKAILDRIIDGQYAQGALQIVQHKRKWFVLISYSMPKIERKLNPDRIMGIDLGIVNAVYWAFNFSNKKKGYIEGGEINAFRRRVENRRKSMLKIAGKTGHGKNRKMLPTQKLQDKIENFKNTINHKYSKKIIDIAIANNCGVIQMEDLNGIEKVIKDNKFLKNWTYGDLQTKIKNKAEREGIEFRLVDPRYTSQKCSECGYTSKDNRINQATFICQKCGTKMNADFNAARNISSPNNKLINKSV